MLTKTNPQTTSEIVCLSEAVLDAPKREIVLTCLQEGHGNLKDRHWYSRACVEGLESKVYARRKVFVSHLQENSSASDGLRDWACTITKTWIEEGAGGRVHRKVRLKVHEDWLWRRCEEAPSEIALSIEGRGEGSSQVIEGETWTVIENIPYLNAFKLVPYPGNAKMGADVVEGASNSEEDFPMDMSKLTIDELKKGRPDLHEAMVKAAGAEIESAAKTASEKLKEAEARADIAEKAKSGDVKALGEQLRKEFDEREAERAKVIEKLVEDKNELTKRLDEKDVRERLAAKGQMVDRMVSASELPPEAKTPRFRETLMRLTEKKDGDKTVSVEEQIKAEIEERAKLCTGGEAKVTESGSGPGSGSISAKIDPDKLNEVEKDIWTQAAFNGEVADQAVIDHRKKLEEDSKKAKEAAAK